MKYYINKSKIISLLHLFIILLAPLSLTAQQNTSSDKSNEGLGKYERIGIIEKELAKTNAAIDSLSKEISDLKIRIEKLEKAPKG